MILGCNGHPCPTHPGLGHPTHTSRPTHPGPRHPHHTVGPVPTVVPDMPVLHHVHHEGKRTLWVVFVIMLISSAVFALRSWNIPVSRRLYHVVTTLITITAAISYFAMATGQATTYNCGPYKQNYSHDIFEGTGKHGHTGHPECRQVFWARYVDWAITTPLLLLDLCLLAGIDGAHTLMAIVADLIMILAGLFAALGTERTAQKWGWFTIACVSYLFVIWHVAVHGARMVTAKGPKVKKLFGSLAAFTLILWTIYPIVWGIADGGKRASVDAEVIAYAVLDVLAKPIFGTWLLIAHRKVPETNIELDGFWSQGLKGDGRIRLGDEEDGH